VERCVDLVLPQVRGAGGRCLHHVGEQLDLAAEGLVGQLRVGPGLHVGTTCAARGGYGHARHATQVCPFG
jgi:hypothetical protein